MSEQPAETVTQQMINLHDQGILVAACIPNNLPDCAYPSTQQLLDAGIPIIQDFPLHTLAVKSMWALGQTSSMVKTVELLSSNIVGEQLN